MRGSNGLHKLAVDSTRPPSARQPPIDRADLGFGIRIGVDYWPSKVGFGMAGKSFDFRRFDAELSAELERVGDLYGNYTFPERNLFHYCPLDAGCKIIDNERLWFTERAHLTDTSEIAFGLDIAMRIYSKRKGSNDLVRALTTRMFKKSLPEILSQNDIFVCCFSMVSDSLEQWRMYADDGRGVALEFDSDMTAFRPKEECSIIDNSYRMQYDVRKLIRHLRAIGEIPATILANQPKEVASHEYREALELIHALFGTSVIIAANQYKHRAYAYEREWRLMAMAHSQKVQTMTLHKTRERGAEVVRYLEQRTYPGIRQALRSVRIGPAADETRIGEMKKFLAQRELGNVPIIKSTIPYRSIR